VDSVHGEDDEERQQEHHAKLLLLPRRPHLLCFSLSLDDGLCICEMMRTLRRAFYIERLREGRGQPALRQGVDLESTAKALHAAACRRPHASSVNPGGRDYPRTRSSNIHQSTGLLHDPPYDQHRQI